MDHVNLGIGMVQVAVREPTKDFCGRIAKGRDLVGQFIEVGQTRASCSVLIDIAQYIKLLQRNVRLDMYLRGSTVGTHGDWWGNDFWLRGNTLSNSGVVIVTTVMIFLRDRMVLSNGNDENEEGCHKDRYYSPRGAEGPEGDNGPTHNPPCHCTRGLVVALVQQCSRRAEVYLAGRHQVGDYQHRSPVGTDKQRMSVCDGR